MTICFVDVWRVMQYEYMYWPLTPPMALKYTFTSPLEAAGMYAHHLTEKTSSRNNNKSTIHPQRQVQHNLLFTLLLHFGQWLVLYFSYSLRVNLTQKLLQKRRSVNLSTLGLKTVKSSLNATKQRYKFADVCWRISRIWVHKHNPISSYYTPHKYSSRGDEWLI